MLVLFLACWFLLPAQITESGQHRERVQFKKEIHAIGGSYKKSQYVAVRFFTAYPKGLQGVEIFREPGITYLLYKSGETYPDPLHVSEGPGIDYVLFWDGTTWGADKTGWDKALRKTDKIQNISKFLPD